MIYGLVPFRQHSKRVPNKNMLLIDGVPLVCHSIQQGLLALDEVIVSTDYEEYELYENIPEMQSKRIIYHKREYVADDQLANEYIHMCIKRYNIKPLDSIVLLQPTCPCREPYDIRKALSIHLQSGKKTLSCFRYGFDRMYTTPDSELITPLTYSHSDLSGKQGFLRNSSIYIFRVKDFLEDNTIFGFKNASLYEMPMIKSVDINYIEDYNLAKSIIEGGLIGWRAQRCTF
jgi:N-acylneuraminate cytidylyltransferase